MTLQPEGIVLAVNDTDLSRRLQREGNLPSDIWVETSGPRTEDAVEVFAGRSLLLHNGLWDWSLAHPAALQHEDALTVTRRRAAATGTPWLSVHIGFASPTVMYDGAMLATTPVLDRAVLLERMAHTVTSLQERLAVPLLLENLDDQDSPAYDHICEADFITELVDLTGAHLLLDLAHAQVSAARQGVGIDDYLGALPLDRVRQIHLSGPRPDAMGGLHDAHETLREEDLDLLVWVLDEAPVSAVTLEYGREADALLHDLDQIRRALSGFTQPKPA